MGSTRHGVRCEGARRERVPRGGGRRAARPTRPTRDVPGPLPSCARAGHPKAAARPPGARARPRAARDGRRGRVLRQRRLLQPHTARVLGPAPRSEARCDHRDGRGRRHQREPGLHAADRVRTSRARIQAAGPARGRGPRPRDVLNASVMSASVMNARRILVIGSATVATIVAVGALLFIPLSIAVGKPQNAIVELALLVVCVWWVARVMRADRRRRLATEATLPPEQRPPRRQPRRPITFQLRETLVTFAIWATLIFAFDAIGLGMDPFVNVGVSAFAGFMLATLTVTGRHMMFRLTAEEDEQARHAEENG